ncbi:transglycosylase domain-containing protein, partial [bacterium]|nr:transglycosylase domain-containing protein [bacterium]
MNSNYPAAPPTPAQPRKHRRRMAWWRWAFLIVAAFTTVVSAVGVGVFIGILRELPAPETLEYYDPPQVSHVFDRSGAVEIGQFRNKDKRRQVVTLDEIPATLRNAFVAIEDRRFFDHYGVDLIGVLRALKADLMGGRGKQGASTITMQLARDKEILPIVGREKTYWRKIKEAVFALEIERRYSKKQILEFYLNHIDFGNAAFGVAAAANTFFSKPLSQLSLAECATIAAIPNGPGKYSPVKNPENTKARRNLVLNSMYDCGYITKAERDATVAEPLRIKLGGQSSTS